MSETSFTAAIVQMRSTIDPSRNIADMSDLVARAAGNGAQYVQTPEMTGALVQDRTALMAMLHDEDNDPVVAASADLAVQHSIYLHVGSTAIAVSGGKVANRSFLFAPDGSVIARYDKIHMFDVDLDNGESWRESRTYEAGNNAVVACLPFAWLGLAICYDVRFPALFRNEAESGANVLTVPAAFTRQTGEAHWHVLLRARAIENGAFVIAAAQGGTHQDGRETYGHSMIIDPWGKVLAEIPHDEPAVATARIDVDASRVAREKIPNLRNQRAFDVEVTAEAKHADALV
ncbi:MAG: carbon-nitrogen hydrolase family protein [Alphaproteobacteria bacterium]|nr:carbon-nitrogen hydrolase family protein [Alphaproteobacteria bacterium]